MNLLEVVLKLLLAVSCGGLIGLEREASNKPAGLRTNILVCMSSALVMILSGLMIQGATGGDLLRVAAAVVTGIGFLGAGTIIQARGVVAGLTTASTLWAVSGLGLVIGAGYYLLAVVFAALVLLILISLGKIETAFLKKTPFHYHLKIKEETKTLSNIKRLAVHLGLKLEGLRLRKAENHFLLSFMISATEEKEQKFSQSLLEFEEILELGIE